MIREKTQSWISIGERTQSCISSEERTQSRIFTETSDSMSLQLEKELKVVSLLLKGDSKSTLYLEKRLKVESLVKKELQVQSSQKLMTQSHFIEKGLKVPSLFEERTKSRIFNFKSTRVRKDSNSYPHFTFSAFTF